MNEDLERILIEQSYDEREEFAIFAIRELAHFSSPRIYERLVEIIENEDSINKVESAIYCFSRLKPTDYVAQILLKQLFNQEERIRAAAARVLSKLQERILPEIKSILLDQELKEKDTQLIWLVGQIGRKEELDILQTLKKKIKEKNLIHDAIEDACNSIVKKNVNLWFKKANEGEEKS
ncbi:MAG: HEAT repeat domain-containing protein [Candidatus Heimdallarchaeaceae archaeon]